MKFETTLALIGAASTAAAFSISASAKVHTRGRGQVAVSTYAGLNLGSASVGKARNTPCSAKTSADCAFRCSEMGASCQAFSYKNGVCNTYVVGSAPEANVQVDVRVGNSKWEDFGRDYRGSVKTTKTCNTRAICRNTCKDTLFSRYNSRTKSCECVDPEPAASVSANVELNIVHPRKVEEKPYRYRVIGTSYGSLLDGKRNTKPLKFSLVSNTDLAKDVAKVDYTAPRVPGVACHDHFAGFGPIPDIWSHSKATNTCSFHRGTVYPNAFSDVKYDHGKMTAVRRHLDGAGEEIQRLDGVSRRECRTACEGMDACLLTSWNSDTRSCSLRSATSTYEDAAEDADHFGIYLNDCDIDKNETCVPGTIRDISILESLVKIFATITDEIFVPDDFVYSPFFKLREGTYELGAGKSVITTTVNSFVKWIGGLFGGVVEEIVNKFADNLFKSGFNDCKNSPVCDFTNTHQGKVWAATFKGSSIPGHSYAKLKSGFRFRGFNTSPRTLDNNSLWKQGNTTLEECLDLCAAADHCILANYDAASKSCDLQAPVFRNQATLFPSLPIRKEFKGGNNPPDPDFGDNVPCENGSVLRKLDPEDTCESLSNRFRVTRSNLALFNGKVADKIESACKSAGRKLADIAEQICVPPSCPGNTVPVTLAAGESCDSVLTDYELTLDAFVQSNKGVNCAALKAGDEVCLPPTGPTFSCAAGSQAYRVQHGDTCYNKQIQAGMPDAVFQKFNPKTPCGPNLKPGHVICLTEPHACPAGQLAVRIDEGDTCWDLAFKYGNSIEQFAAANDWRGDFDCNRLRLGDLYCMPDNSASRVCPDGTATHIVKENDTCWALVRQYNNSEEQFLEANAALHPDGPNCLNLRIGDKLCFQ